MVEAVEPLPLMVMPVVEVIVPVAVIATPVVDVAVKLTNAPEIVPLVPV